MGDLPGKGLGTPLSLAGSALACLCGCSSQYSYTYLQLWQGHGKHSVWAGTESLLCVEPYSVAHAVLNGLPHSLLPLDSGFRLYDRHYFQVCSGTILHALGEGMWRAGWTMGTSLNIGSLYLWFMPLAHLKLLPFPQYV